jgi:hypothetical protein
MLVEVEADVTLELQQLVVAQVVEAREAALLRTVVMVSQGLQIEAEVAVED